MTAIVSFLYVISGIFKMLISPFLLVLSVKKINARIKPFIAGVVIYIPIFLLRGLIRNSLPRDDAGMNFLYQAIVTSVIEEAGRVIAFVYMADYRRASDAVSYGAGHAVWENFGAGMLTISLLFDDSLKLSAVNAISGSIAMFSGTLFSMSLSVFALYGVRNDKIKYALPVNIFIHFITVLVFSGNELLEVIETALLCFFACKFYETIEEQS